MHDLNKPLQILIVNSDEASRLSLSTMLHKYGHDVLEAATIVQAVALMNSKRGIQLAILDGSTTGDNLGILLARELRELYGSQIYIILLTAPHVTAIESDADDFLGRHFTEPELCARLRLGSRMLDLQKAHHEIQHVLQKAASYDDLTGLWNRRMILDQLGRELNRARHQEQPLALAIADIDRFKKVNDTYGHTAGDTVLRETAAALRLNLRSYDYIGRYGGEEFLMLLPSCDIPAGFEIARRLCESIASTPIHTNTTDVPVTVSIGISSTIEAGVDSATLIAMADEALFQAKADGRNRVAVHSLAPYFRKRIS